MQLELVDNVSQKLLFAILPVIEEAEEVKIAVAFVSTGGIALVDSALRRCLDRGGYIEFLVGLDLLVTKPEALWKLYWMSQNYANVACYCFADIGPSVVYHPKLYVMKTSDKIVTVVGSSNLTEGGLKRNLEINALIRAIPQEEVVSDIYAAYNCLKFHPLRVEPDDEFLSLYSELHSKRLRQDKSVKRDQEFSQLTSTFRNKVTRLRRPVLTKRDLYGWQKLVFERLPEGQFRTRDIYEFEDEFRSYYPENQNLRAKIRQILQQLRDLKLIEHPKRETWIKRGG